MRLPHRLPTFNLSPQSIAHPKYTIKPLPLPHTCSRPLSTNHTRAKDNKDATSLTKTGWAVGDTEVHKTFRFKGFKKCWEFMDLVAKECVVQKHHPEWSNVYNTTFIRWTTHSPPGLSEKDILMAKFCDEKAEECGAVKDSGEDSRMEGLANTVAKEGGDCCIPKSKGG